MKQWTAFACSAALLLLCRAAHGGGQPLPILPGDIPAVTAAVPANPATRSAKARRVLVFTAADTEHRSTPLAAKAMEILGSKTHAFDATATGDLGQLESPNLAVYDAVLMLNTGGDPFMKIDALGKDAAKSRRDRLRQNLLDFVAGGKGFVGIHAATDCFHDWPEYGQLIGGFYAGRPFRRVTVKVDDPAHPVNASLNGQGFTVEDEIYSFQYPYSRQFVHVLLSVDWEKSGLIGGTRGDKDYALAWVKSYGKGRVFYFAPGHEKKIYMDARFLRYILDGIQFAVGDLPGETAPSEAAARPATRRIITN